jgi:hypothetical protein
MGITCATSVQALCHANFNGFAEEIAAGLGGRLFGSGQRIREIGEVR